MPSAAPTPPDGGYGYLIVATSWCSQFLFGSMWVGFATLMVELRDHFQTSEATVALTGALLSGTMNFGGLLVGVLIHWFGPRPICIIGALVSTVATIATSFATNIYVTYFTYGVIGGLGSVAFYLPAIVIVQQYFTRKRALTTGIASTGLSFGALLVGPFYRLLMDRFGWRFTLMMHACLMIQGVVIGATFRPIETGQTTHQDQLVTKANDGSLWQTFRDGLRDWKIIFHKQHLLFLIGGLLWEYGVITMYSLGPSRAVSQGMDKFLASFIPSAIATCSLISRFINSFIANMKCTNVILQFGILTTCSGVIMCLSCVTASFYGSVLFAGAYGLSMGGFLAIFATVTVELVGITHASRAQGMLMAFWGISGLAAMPIGGWIYDKTSNYNISFLIGGLITIAGGCCSFVILLMRRGVSTQSSGNEEVVDQLGIDAEKVSVDATNESNM